MGDSKYKVQEFVAHSTRVNCLSFGPKSNQVLATGGEDCKVNIWRVGNVSNIWTLGQNKSPIECLCFDADEQCVVSGTTNGSLKVFDLNVGKLARNLGSHPVGITSVQYHPYGEFIVSGSVDCTMKVWDVREKNCIQTYNGHTKEITCVRFSPDGKWVASAAKDGQMQFWDLIAGKLVNSIKLTPVYVRTFEFSPADFTVAAATSMRTVRFWDLDTMQPIGTTTSESNPLQAIAYSTLGNALYTASKDTLRLWDLEPSLTMRNTVDAGWEKIDDMRVSNNYQLVAGSCLSNFVSVWSVDLQELMDANVGQQEEGNPDVARDRFSTKSNDRDGAGSVGYSGKHASAGAKAVESSPVVAPAPARGTSSSGPTTQQAQLSDVRRQLAQLNTEVGYGDRDRPSAGIGAQDKASAGADRYDRAADRDAGNAVGAASRAPAGRYAEAKSADVRFAEADEKAYGRARNGRDGSADPCNAAADAKGGEAADEEVPQVVWENGHSRSQEMATSMGESFWKRFKQSQALHPGSDAEVCAVQDEEVPEEMYDEDSDFAEDDAADDLEYELQKRMSAKEEVGVTEEELEDLLPPPSYGSYESGSAGQGGARGGSSAGVGPFAAAAQKKAEDRFSVNSQRAAVRSSPLVTASPLAAPAAGDAGVSDDGGYPANYARKAPTPSFPKGPQRGSTPSGGNFELQPPSSVKSGNGSNKSNRDATPDSDPSRGGGGGSGMEVVGMRHLRSPAGAVAGPSSNDGPRGYSSGAAGPSSRAPASSFAAGNNNGGDSESKRVTDLLDQLLTDAGPARTALAQRLQSLKLMRLLWERGETADAIDHLTVLSDALQHSVGNLSTLADFFDAVELKGNGLNLDSCVKLLPILEAMISHSTVYSSEHVMYATLKSLASLAEGYGELIRNTRATIIVSGGVDLSREARLNKCNACYAVFMRVDGRTDMLKRQFRASRTTVDMLDVFHDLCVRYFV